MPICLPSCTLEKQANENAKTARIGLVNRETKQSKAFVVENADKECLLPKIGGNVKEKSVVITDTYGVYKDLKNNFAFFHIQKFHLFPLKHQVFLITIPILKFMFPALAFLKLKWQQHLTLKK